jgi:putative ABC transport system permease protein
MSSFSNWVSQVVSVSHVSLQTVWERKCSSSAATFGIAGVVAVMVGVLSIAQGFRHTMTSTGLPDAVIVMRTGAGNEMSSGLGRDDARIIADAPGLAKNANGPLVSAELFVIIDLPKRSTGTAANVPLRGVGPAALDVRGNMRIVEGRMFERGKNEVIVGAAASGQFAGLDLNHQIKVGQEQWTVVGIFSANGGISESEIWTDSGVLQSAYKRGDSYNAIHARLESADGFKEFKDSLTADPRLKVMVVRQSEYYEEQSALVYRLITGLGTLVAGLMGVGAIFGALNTMYTAVSARTREIATLRALGFGSGSVVISVLIESVCLALIGGTIGGGLAYLAFDGYQAATINFASFSQVAFAFSVTPALLIQGIVYATLIGLIGGFFPAIRAARLPIATALREV